MINTLIFIITFVNVQAQVRQVCPSNCYSCYKSGPAYCDSCSEGYQRSNSGQCVPGAIVQNCQEFGPRNTCFKCKPTYRLFSNMCVKMYDGCLESGVDSFCNKCLQGAYLNSFGLCDLKYLNCLQVSESGKCVQCMAGYRLEKETSKCVNNDTDCSERDVQSGLCLRCISGFKMIGYRCVSNSVEFKNCYLISETLDACIYCKLGYQIFHGRCYPPNVIRDLLQGPDSPLQCAQNQYFNPSSRLCNSLPNLCQKFDYGLLKCSFCWSANVLIDNYCREPSLRFCASFLVNNPYRCQTCQSKFYTTEMGLCAPYPTFCQQVKDQRCVRCISGFLLNSKGFCEDPHCQIRSSITYECQACKSSYYKDNVTGVCTFRDVNCLELSNNTACKRCRTNYEVDEKTGVCKFVDPDCKIFSDKDECLECKHGYYQNSFTKLCMELPYKCLSANSEGKCQYCAEGYALRTSFQCERISNITNCLIQSEINPKYCQICKENYYRTDNGSCSETPVLCINFNPKKKECVQCSPNADLRGGYCYDQFCEVFGPEAQCYGCKNGYQFGKKGQCITYVEDTKCKEFIYGQCKKCSEGYYFDKYWNCASVSPLCKTYDPNNGNCKSCYSGYVIEGGKCIRENQQNICVGRDLVTKQCIECSKNYFLVKGNCYRDEGGCIQYSNEGICLECFPNYFLEQSSGICILTSSLNADSNCLEVGSDGCDLCVTRMYYDPSFRKCTVIDANCREYLPNGTCTVCYDGYSPNPSNPLKCVLSKPLDPNCKIRSQEGCSQCYGGYYYSPQQEKCTVSNQLCRQSNTNNGDCTSCWEGYELKTGQCVVASQPTQAPATSNASMEIVNTQLGEDIKCVQYTDGLCSQCVIGAVFDSELKSCEYPDYGNDDNCIQYKNRICVRCRSLFTLQAHKCQSHSASRNSPPSTT